MSIEILMSALSQHPSFPLTPAKAGVQCYEVVGSKYMTLDPSFRWDERV